MTTTTELSQERLIRASRGESLNSRSPKMRVIREPVTKFSASTRKPGFEISSGLLRHFFGEETTHPLLLSGFPAGCYARLGCRPHPPVPVVEKRW